MGEFMVDAPIREDKMGETVASNSSLQVSVSFGRFERESLSWEKWSSFSPNKYLEEVEKCATPGSVAQKKAYFEAHYKKIAARKAELLDQERQMEKDRLKSEDLSDKTCGTDAEFDASNNTCRADAEFHASKGQGSFIKEIKQATNSTSEVSGVHMDGMVEDIAESRDYQSTSTDEEKKEPESRSDGSQLGTTEPEAVYAKEESHPIDAENVKEELSGNVDNGIAKGQASQVEAKDVKLDHQKESKKFGQVNHVNKESSATKTKRKQVVPTSKAHQISTPRSSRPTSMPTKTLPSASSNRKGNSPSLSGRKTPSTQENKRVVNKSLHMSLSLGPSNNDPVSLTPVRKSFIMEKMGDKDIVKRAFKTFQNNFNQSKTSGEARPLVKGQVPSKGTEAKAPTSISLRKENGRPRTVDSMDKRSGNVARSTVGLKSDIRAVKGKEPSKKMMGKSNAKEAERTRLQSKPKEEKWAETKRSKQNVKTTTLPTFYRGQKVPERGVLSLRILVEEREGAEHIQD
ncbi:protein WVD2-like 7 isoform X2 [Neltuma alba]|uniref:protein WVD2-like 7 isoform X2 n=1 Tax=Neltuma alba TaxID=207710 RepID=UPI0010A2E771|nr:protein WVD2-like 7 isoform X2 [Prosopis alba]